jgi:hypothetical protein
MIKAVKGSRQAATSEEQRHALEDSDFRRHVGDCS